MLLQRLQVEEGFLDGLDLEFHPGLNVLIGARGTGKTSVIELIRYALGVQGYTADSAKRSLEHARSVLGAGRVVASIVVGGKPLRVVRSATDAAPRADGRFVPPIMFSQTEIESVGLDRAGRLRLLDSFRDNRRGSDSTHESLTAAIKSLCTDIEARVRDIAAWEEQLAQIAPTQAALKEIASKEHAISKTSALAAARKKQLDHVSEKLAAVAVKQDVVLRAQQALTVWQAQVDVMLKRQPVAEPWPGPSDVDPLADIRAEFAQVREAAATIQKSAQSIAARLHKRNEQYTVERSELDEQARAIRREIEGLQQGAGEVARTAAGLRERLAQLNALKPALDKLRKTRDQLSTERDHLLDELDADRQTRFDERQRIADELNSALGPLIHVELEQAGHSDEYAQNVADALRGSGIRYNEIAPQIANQISPRELLGIVESSDADGMSSILGISRDRALRIVSQLRDKSLADIAVSSIDDAARFSLLDGSERKDLAELSTGQRCTVVLPIILQHRDRTLIVDQPEDHIDNGFIVATIIAALRRRPENAQIIFSTHNANIPVLGEADQVVLMGSDGRRGFVLQSTPLDDPRAVTAITGIMEGGRDAFFKRAEFYLAIQSP